MTELYHFTCDHGRLGIGDAGCLLNAKQQGLKVPKVPRYQARLFELIWVTDLETPIREALGLTSFTISCDRTRYRYKVTDAYTVDRWLDVRKDFPQRFRDELERASGALPAHWFVSSMPVPVVYDPVGV